MTTLYRRRSQRSLRTILIVWFLIFSIVPLAFLTGFSILRYDKAINRELGHRLEGNARELVTMLSEFRTSLQQKRDRQISDPAFVYHLSTNHITELNQISKNWLHSDISTGLGLFSRNGRMLVTVTKQAGGNVKEYIPTAREAVYISDENLANMSDLAENSFVEMNVGQKISLILLSKAKTTSAKPAGYIEQIIEIDKDFLDGVKNRLRAELILLRKNGNVIVSTHPDFYEYKKDFFSKYTEQKEKSFFGLTIRTEPYEFIMYPVQWGQTDFYIAIGVSKKDAQAVLKGVNYAFFSVAISVSILLIVIALIISNSILKPLDDLVQATQDLPSRDQLVEIPIKSDTEIGLLTESFNEMSRQILRIRNELKAKINELEAANKEIKDTQSRLVHSSKMSSLGQLVAGVAHELNNPISFIYSNMAHLREYSEKLIQLAEAVEEDPKSLKNLKQKLEIDYVKSDMPKLIASCEDGARRVRDIVLGLRNFSRLEEAKLKEVDIHEAIDNTLNLLAGEIKTRILINKNYGELPPVTCFASQLNQVFMNILANAVHAIEGAGSIWITTKPYKSSNNIQMISISIQDSGKGIPQNEIDKIFDPFFSTKAVGQGTGLGLSISYGIIQNHGGEILVKSRVGTGTDFIINIPVIQILK